MKKRLFLVFFSFLFLFFFALFSFVVKKDLLTSFDFNTTVKIQDHIPQRLDQIFFFLSFLASFQVTTLLLFIFIILKRQFRGFLVLMVFMGAHFVELIGKLYLDHPGPPFMFFRQKETTISLPENYVVGSSYPSGHSLRIFFLALIIVFFAARLTKNRVVPLLFFFGAAFFIAATTALGKVVLGHHWPSDIIAGALIGLSAGFAAISFFQTKPLT